MFNVQYQPNKARLGQVNWDQPSTYSQQTKIINKMIFELIGSPKFQNTPKRPISINAYAYKKNAL